MRATFERVETATTRKKELRWLKARDYRYPLAFSQNRAARLTQMKIEWATQREAAFRVHRELLDIKLGRSGWPEEFHPMIQRNNKLTLETALMKMCALSMEIVEHQFWDDLNSETLGRS